MLKNKKILFIMITVVMMIVAGCSNNKQTEHSDKHDSTAHGDIHETTSSTTKLPSFLDNKSEEMKNLYLAVAKHKDLLNQIPCYCGCGDSAGHKDNYNCFIHEIKEDGSVVWDDHGTKCKTCLDTAAISIYEYENGKSPLEIRQLIDDTFKEGYSDPTPTPMPES